MIYNSKLTKFIDRTDAVSKIASLKYEIGDRFTMIDIGGVAGSWSDGYATHVVDIQRGGNPKIQYFTGNISRPFIWDSILRYVDEHGKFDFCSCTHTLEDVSAAGLVCDMFSRISKEGYVAVPSKYVELKRGYGDRGTHLGWYHHRWIFDLVDDQFIGYPKQPFLEHEKDIDDWSAIHPEQGREELQFFWKDNINLKIINDDHLTPNIESCVAYYKSGLLT